MAPLQISLANVTDRVTDHAMWALAAEFACIDFRCGLSDREALRKTIRAIVNQKVVDAPETVNDDPYGEGWLVRIRVGDPSEVDALLDVDAYKQVVAEQ